MVKAGSGGFPVTLDLIEPTGDFGFCEFGILGVLFDADVPEAFKDRGNAAATAAAEGIEESATRLADQPGEPTQERDGLNARMAIASARRQIAVAFK